MSAETDPPVTGTPVMSSYELQVWESLLEHWERRNNRRGLPNWAGNALERTGDVTRGAVSRTAQAVPAVIKTPIRHAGGAVADVALRPVLKAAVALLELTNAWAMELNDPKGVEELARKRGIELDTFTELRGQDLKVCDQLLSSNTLKWRSIGALEGGTMGALALVPVAGIPVALTADVVVIQVLSTSIAARIAYSYGYDAKDPAERLFIESLVARSFMAQAAKAEPLRDTARAAHALKGRVNWSDKLRKDHRLVSGLEKLMKHLGPTGGRVPVQNVAKVVPFVGVIVGAGMNSAVLGRVANDAQRYCQTRFLCEKYGLPMPAALATYEDTEPTP